jgi:hypothetical protein
MKTLHSDSSVPATITKPDGVTIMALVIIMLLTVHLSGDVVYGYEPSGLRALVGVPIVCIWLYGALALAGRDLAPVGRLDARLCAFAFV